MFYSEKYIFEKINSRLKKTNIYKTNENNKSFFIIEYKNCRVKVDLDKFLNRLSDIQSDKSDKLVENFVFQLTENLITQSNFSIKNFSKDYFLNNIYPVIRSVSFAKNQINKFIYSNHTNETKIFYSLDLDTGYKLITKDILEYYNIDINTIIFYSNKNLKRLSFKYNTEVINNNTFYFLNSKDGYEASRILNNDILKYFFKKIEGTFYIGVPNQDALIIADIKNKKGLEILQKTMISFFTDGRVPITTITFKYDGNNLESLFIFVQ